MNHERAREIITACIDALAEDTSEQRFGMLFVENPDAADAVLAYFRGRYLAGEAPVASWEEHPVGQSVMRLIASFGSSAVRQGFIELGLSVRCDALLGHMIRSVVKPDELAQAVIDALDAPEPRPRFASELAYFTFDAGGEADQPSLELGVLMSEKLRLYNRAHGLA